MKKQISKHNISFVTSLQKLINFLEM